MDEFYISNDLATPMPLPSLLPSNYYESLTAKCNTKESYDIKIIGKTTELVIGLTITPLIPKMVENLVDKSALTFDGYFMPQNIFLGSSSYNYKLDMMLKYDDY